MHWETKNFIGLALLRYSLYCGGLEPHPQYLRGMPVHSARRSGLGVNSLFTGSKDCRAVVGRYLPQRLRRNLRFHVGIKENNFIGKGSSI